jgi:hypothetical protein
LRTISQVEIGAVTPNRRKTRAEFEPTRTRLDNVRLAHVERVAAKIVAVQLDQVARAAHCGALTSLLARSLSCHTWAAVNTTTNPKIIPNGDSLPAEIALKERARSPAVRTVTTEEIAAPTKYITPKTTSAIDHRKIVQPVVQCSALAANNCRCAHIGVVERNQRAMPVQSSVQK